MFIRPVILTVAALLPAVAFAGDTAAPVSTATSSDIEQRLSRIERFMQNQGLLELLHQVDTLQQELDGLRGELEVSNHQLEQMRQRQRDLYIDIDRRLQALDSRNNPATVNTTSGSTTDVQILNGQPTTGKQPAKIMDNNGQVDSIQMQQQYQQAFQLLKQARYRQATKAFKEFLKAYPDIEYSDNAQYWLAEMLYVKRQYKEAIQQYNALIKNYPDSSKVPDSLLKIGYSYQETGEKDKAKLWYTDVRKRYPQSTAARLAEEKLRNN